MPKKLNVVEYAVQVKISGTATVFTRAASEDEAIKKVNRGDFYGGEIGEWFVADEDAISAQVNI